MRTPLGIFTLLTILILPVLYSARGGAAVVSKPDTVVAEVYNHNILSSEVSVPLEVARDLYLLQSNADGKSKIPTAEDVRTFARQRQISNLASMIRDIVSNHEIERLKITLGEQEIRDAWDKFTEGMNFTAMAEKSAAEARLLLLALSQVHEQGMDADKVYDQLLAGKVPPTAWKIYVKQYKSLDSREGLTKLADATAKDFKPDESFKQLILQEKLKEVIDQEISASDKQFATYKAQLTSKKPINGTATKLDYLQEKRQAWWRQRYKEADIKVHNVAFKEALDLLGVSIPATPNTESHE